MEILTVLKYPDPLLRQRALEVTTFDTQLSKTVEDMTETMRASNGVGLAATQVGIMSRLFVLEFRKRLLHFINPEIINASGEVVLEEACLSLPNVARMVTRAKNITVQYQTIEGIKYETIFKGFIARIIQHELDHLDGILIIDRSSEEPSE
jgi:peptide deformylase